MNLLLNEQIRDKFHIKKYLSTDNAQLDELF